MNTIDFEGRDIRQKTINILLNHAATHDKVWNFSRCWRHAVKVYAKEAIE